MFAKACAIAREFTLPIIVSSRTYKGDCSSGIGTFIIINDEGWFVTAFHIINQIKQFDDQLINYKKIMKERQNIIDDTNLTNNQKKQKLGTIKIHPNSITNYSSWFGRDGLILDQVKAIPEADLAVGKLRNFKKEMIKNYPKFKNPNQPMEQGTSLCKLGFPFHSIKPIFESDSNNFILPAGSLPIPIFPIEGIYTRTVNIPSAVTRKYPSMYIETSTPGLRGQSGGPTFDVNGAIWAIQSRTQHFKLGFGENQKNDKEGEHLKNQYLNVGWGTHSATVTGFLTELGIAFQYY